MAVGKDVPLVQRQLARELHRLRVLAGVDQRAIAERLGISQSTVSRAERAEKTLSLPEVLAWAETCSATQEEQDRLTTLAKLTFTQLEPWRDLLPESPQLQDAVKVNEATTRTLLNYSPIVIPGLLQTPAYAEQVLRLTNYAGDMDEAASLAGRWRRQEALADRSRKFGFLLPEAVLRWSPAGPQVLASQLERVATVASQDNVAVGLIRDGQESILPLHGFIIYADRGEDDPFVVIELLHSYMTINEPGDVAIYREMYDRMAASALSKSDTVNAIQRLALELRTLSLGRPD